LVLSSTAATTRSMVSSPQSSVTAGSLVHW
jgi:hypothetical protein